MKSKRFSFRPRPWLLALPLLGVLAPLRAQSSPDAELPALTVTAPREPAQTPAGVSIVDWSGAARAAAAGDSARLLLDVPGVSLYGAGGVSSLPALHGLADDRLRIRVDGMDLISACANHMNPPLSYIDPAQIGRIEVYTGVVPVSVGGDSIGGAIVVQSPEPQFVPAGAQPVTKGEAGLSYRSNGNGRGAHLSLTHAREDLSLRYDMAAAQSGNYQAAADFKSALLPAQNATTVAVPAAREVGSSQYLSMNQSLSLARRRDNHLFELRLGLQNIPYQGFPNQRMDMTGNRSEQFNLRYRGRYDWGDLESRLYHEHTRHQMNLLDNKLQTNNPAGMPMDTEGRNTGVRVQADLPLSLRDTLTLGGEAQRYRLSDWWDPISAVVAPPHQGMKGVTFWNINDGRRDRFDLFAEWTARWNPRWQTQLGARSATVWMGTGEVNGYNPINYPPASYAAFNAADRSRQDQHLDLSVLARHTPQAGRELEFGYTRKSRSPNLYERYSWSTNNVMVMNMINWFGDGNGYVGNLDLRPETAHTVSATARWGQPEPSQADASWGLQLTPYYTYVENYIDAVPCALLGKTCPARTDGFVNLSFANQSAHLHGLDVAGHRALGAVDGWGRFSFIGRLSYQRGTNGVTGDNLYHIMPLNARLTLQQRLRGWTHALELLAVADKSDVSATRRELRTAGYALLNLRSSHTWQRVRLDLGIENLLDRAYAHPLGGVYLGEGNVMGGGATSGIAVPGPGRSLYAAVAVQF